MFPKPSRTERNADTPLLIEEGWLRDQESCEATFNAQTGRSEMFLTAPSLLTKDALGDFFLEVASTPALEEGTKSS